jgi:hypothetical protein
MTVVGKVMYIFSILHYHASEETVAWKTGETSVRASGEHLVWLLYDLRRTMMVAEIETWPKAEERGVVRYLYAKGLTTTEIRHELEAVMGRKQVTCIHMTNEDEPRSVTPRSSTADDDHGNCVQK